jgi:hypothetical protein
MMRFVINNVNREYEESLQIGFGMGNGITAFL